MKEKYKAKYNNSDGLIELNGVGIQDHIVSLYGPDIAVNLSGFVLYAPDGTVFRDCSGFRYRYDILEDNPDAVHYTDQADMVQTEKWNVSSIDQVEEEPLTNEELTECVAELMYETSLMRLGIGMEG
ncbi:MAG: hypothetical protein NC399_06370 [Muribaculum sp.]|nr:hypothetical protein [Muribaculum sp.]